MPKRLLAPILLLFCQSSVASATDGVLEINQACAVQMGCFAGDASGFPVTIGAPGSYRLTGNLSPPDIDTTAIDLQSNDVTLDLAGFGIVFPGNGCLSRALCPQGTGDGIGRSGAFGRRVTVRNGFIMNAGRRGIWLSDIAIVEVVRVNGCGEDGILLGPRSILTQSHVNGCGAAGANLGGNTVFSHSVFAFNNKLQGAADRVGGIPTIGNKCGDRSCSPRARGRSYYLTDEGYTGAQAGSACAAGFHVASLYELLDPSALEYEPTLGRAPVGAAGPDPTERGWAYFGPSDNCSGYTSTSGTGTRLRLVVPQFQEFGPWQRTTNPCSPDLEQVWCIED